jgi:hypothetical protein
LPCGGFDLAAAAVIDDGAGAAVSSGLDRGRQASAVGEEDLSDDTAEAIWRIRSLTVPSHSKSDDVGDVAEAVIS